MIGLMRALKVLSETAGPQEAVKHVDLLWLSRLAAPCAMLKSKANDSADVFLVCRAGPYDILAMHLKQSPTGADHFLVDADRKATQLVIKDLEWCATMATPVVINRKDKRWQQAADDNCLIIKADGEFKDLAKFPFIHKKIDH